MGSIAANVELVDLALLLGCFNALRLHLLFAGRVPSHQTDGACDFPSPLNTKTEKMMARKILIISLLLVVLQVANAAANWTRIGNTDFFYDTNSIRTHGELASMDVRKVGVEGGVANWEIDCKRRLLITRNESLPIRAGDDLEPVANRACKNKWQFWK